MQKQQMCQKLQYIYLSFVIYFMDLINDNFLFTFLDDIYILNFSRYTMSFLTLRQEIDNWTLKEDDQFFSTVKSLSDAIFQSERQINEKISHTKYSLHEGQVNLGFNFNQFLRLSEFKFTENKIQQRVKDQVQQPKQQPKQQSKTKMEVYKDALAIGLKNMEIKEQDGDKEKDNMSVMSVSEYSFSMSQAVFKNTRLPPLFGTKEFTSKPYLNLYTEEDANEINQYRRSMSMSIISPDNLPQSDLPFPREPPPPLDQVLNNNFSSPEIGNAPRLSQILGVPSGKAQVNIPTNIPPLSGVIPDVPVLNIPSPQLTESFIGRRTQFQANIPLDSASKPVIVQQQQKSQQALISQPQIKKALSFQQELNLRLLKGKNYKVQPIVQEVLVANQQSKIQQKQSPKRPFDNNTKQTEKVQPIISNPVSKPQSQRVQASLRQSVNYNDIIGGKNNNPVEEEEEQQAGIWAKSGTRKKQPQIQKVITQPDVKKKNQEDEIMKSNTFNTDLIFVKKKNIANIIIAKKPEPPKKSIFVQQSDEEEQITLSKPIKKAQVKQQKKSNPIIVNKVQTSQAKTETVNIVQKPKQVVTPVKQAPKKKGGLFDDDDETDDFMKKKKQEKPKQIKKPVAAKKNILLGNDSDDDFIKKPLPKVPLAKVQSKPQVKSPLISPIKSQVKEVKQVIKQTIVQKKIVAEIIEEKPKQDIVITKQVQKIDNTSDLNISHRQKKKSNLLKANFDEEEDSFIKEGNNKSRTEKNRESNTEKSQKTEIKIISNMPLVNRQEQPQPTPQIVTKKDPKKIAGLMMGMGMGPMIPAGMILTKPSEVKNQQKIANERAEQEKKRQEQHRIKEQKLKKLKLIQNEEQQRLQEVKRIQMIKENNVRLAQQNAIKQQERIQYQRQQNQKKALRKRQQAQQLQRQRQQQQASQRQKLELQKHKRQKQQREQQQRIERQKQQKQNDLREKQRAQKQRKQSQERQKEIQQQLEIERLRQIQRQRQKEKQRERERIKIERQQRQRLQYERMVSQQKQKEERQRRQREDLQRKQREEKERLAKQKKALLSPTAVPKMPSKGGLPILPGNDTKKITTKRGLFDQDEDKPLVPEKKVEKKVQPATKKNLFDDDGDDFSFKPKPKAEKKQGQKKKSLFDDQEEQPYLVAKKPPVQKQKAVIQVKQQPKKKNLFDDDQQTTSVPVPKQVNIAPQKAIEKPKKNLYDDEQEQVVVKPKQQPKIAVQIPVKIEQPKKRGILDDDQQVSVKPIKKQESIKKVEQIPQSQPATKKKGLFDDQEEDSSPKMKKETIQQVKKVVVAQPVVKKNNLFENNEEQSKPSSKPTAISKPPAPKKKGIFDDDQEDVGFTSKQTATKAATNVATKPATSPQAPTSSPTKKKNLFEDQDDTPIISSKPKVQKKPAQSKNLFNDDQDEITTKKAPSKPSANNKKKLFDDSD